MDRQTDGCLVCALLGCASPWLCLTPAHSHTSQQKGLCPRIRRDGLQLHNRNPLEGRPNQESRRQESGVTLACAGSFQIPAPRHPLHPSPSAPPSSSQLTLAAPPPGAEERGQGQKPVHFDSPRENQSFLRRRVLHSTGRNGAKSTSLAAREAWTFNLFNFIFFTLGTRMTLTERGLIGEE